jgi:hypothetical protein
VRNSANEETPCISATTTSPSIRNERALSAAAAAMIAGYAVQFYSMSLPE